MFQKTITSLAYYNCIMALLQNSTQVHNKQANTSAAIHLSASCSVNKISFETGPLELETFDLTTAGLFFLLFDFLLSTALILMGWLP